MNTKLSEDIIPLSDLKVNPRKVVNHANDSRRPVLLTNQGRAVAVVQSLDEYEKNEEERAFLKTVAQGMMDVKEGNEISLAEVKKRLGIK